MGSTAITLIIPTFDLTTDPKSTRSGTEQWASMGRAILSAFEMFGCALVKGDAVSGEEREELFEAVQELFELPAEAKRRNTARETLTVYPGSTPVLPLYEAQGVMDVVEVEMAKEYTDLMWPQGND